MDTIESNLKYFMENHGEIYEAYEHYGKLLHTKGGPLTEQSRWLIKVALSTAGQNPYALKTHIKKALKSGCTREEIEHSILLSASTVGFPKMMEAVLTLREVMGETEKTVMTE
ncbi:MAG: carboxymuconolactone decarboxylase family protein [Clostridia bacterium]|jgi:alkylhydroperoxidase/carboxymuconolactone decarboxylase family protein YurZ|nr:carboxymuconolactone decarboxylase family protein [Clostridia bacterium]MDD4571984.1 carboxymuconolactone decarboxylase family protein [Clostridia bacterium]